MRLWHTKLIKVLSNMHLQAQWRELSAIAGAIQKNGTPNHVLVNFVLDYDYDNFISYAKFIREELTNRGIRTMNSVWEKIISLKPNYKILSIEEVYKEKMNKTYLEICYYNLFEKYLCGMFEEDIFNKIKQIYLMSR